jgi:hypothetical protein
VDAGSERRRKRAEAADRIEGVWFQIFDNYERLLIDFGRRDGRPASVPLWSVESPPESGYVRAHFPGVTATEITSEDFVGSVLDELYVVRDRGGGLFADAFAVRAFRYRVTELPEAGRLASDKVVVLQPREAERVGSPLRVQGYARLFEGQVTISLLDRNRGVISSRKVHANDWTTAWWRFAAPLEYSGYKGLATLRVGSNSPMDGLLRWYGDRDLLPSAPPSCCTERMSSPLRLTSNSSPRVLCLLILHERPRPFGSNSELRGVDR